MSQVLDAMAQCDVMYFPVTKKNENCDERKWGSWSCSLNENVDRVIDRVLS